MKNSIIKQVFTKQLGTKINYTHFKAITTTWLQQNCCCPLEWKEGSDTTTVQ